MVACFQHLAFGCPTGIFKAMLSACIFGITAVLHSSTVCWVLTVTVQQTALQLVATTIALLPWVSLVVLLLLLLLLCLSLVALLLRLSLVALLLLFDDGPVRLLKQRQVVPIATVRSYCNHTGATLA